VEKEGLLAPVSRIRHTPPRTSPSSMTFRASRSRRSLT
jgi:hypothetical protein